MSMVKLCCHVNIAVHEEDPTPFPRRGASDELFDCPVFPPDSETLRTRKRLAATLVIPSVVTHPLTYRTFGICSLQNRTEK